MLHALLHRSDLIRRIAGWDWTSFSHSRAALGRPLEGARVLDLGCGPRVPALVLFHAFGARATGIDSEPVRGGGFRRFLKGLLFDRAYYRELERRAERPLPLRGLDILRMDAAALGFPDAHFDLVHSNSVLEHLADVPRALDEVARVLKPDGVASIVVHLFPSLSGGHHLEWAFPDEDRPRRIPPWDHLRGNRFPPSVPLNRLKEGDFVREFERRFVTLETESFRDDDRFLTPEIERELSAYTRDELTKRAIRVVLRRK